MSEGGRGEGLAFKKIREVVVVKFIFYFQDCEYASHPGDYISYKNADRSFDDAPRTTAHQLD